MPAPALAEGKPPTQEAEGYIIEDNSGYVLAEKDPDKQFAPASITKVMTAMVALDSGIPFDTVVTIPELPNDWENAQVAGYEPGTTATFGDLMDVMLVYSANDAAYTIAEKVGGSQQKFEQMMNEKAKAIGMANTTFKNPHGLDQDGHMSCARDLALMGRYALTHYPFIASTVKRPSVEVPVNGTDVVFESTDHLMPVYPALIGIKTGMGETGSTFLGAAASNGVTLYSCVLGCDTAWGRFQDTMDMDEWAFAQFKPLVLAKAGQVLSWHPFAYRFGYAVPVVWDGPADGYIWPGGEKCTYSRVVPSADQLLAPAQHSGVGVWHQGGRLLAGQTCSTPRVIVRASSPALTYGGLIG